MVRVPGFEPGAYRLGGGRSIQLSYTRVQRTPGSLAELDDIHCLHKARNRCTKPVLRDLRPHALVSLKPEPLFLTPCYLVSQDRQDILAGQFRSSSQFR